MWNMKNFVYFLAWNISSFSKVIETNFLSDLNGNDETNKIAFYVENVNWDFVKQISSPPRTNFSFLGGGGGRREALCVVTRQKRQRRRFRVNVKDSFKEWDFIHCNKKASWQNVISFFATDDLTYVKNNSEQLIVEKWWRQVLKTWNFFQSSSPKTMNLKHIQF